MASVRHMIREIQREVRDSSDLLPDRAAELLNKATALLGNISDEVREADAAYATRLMQEFGRHKAASRAKLVAETTPEYDRKRQARDTHELAKQLIITLRQFLRTKSDEMRLTR